MVNIEVKQGEQYSDDFSAFVKFKYDIKYVSLMRSLPTRYWHSDKLVWEVPYSDLDLIINKLDETEYTIKTDKEVFKEKSTIQIPNNYEFKTTPFQHQLEGVEYGLNHNKFLLGDEQGCISGDMIVSFSVGTFHHTSKLSDFYDFYKQCITKDQVKVKCYKNTEIGYYNVQNVLFSGEKIVYKILLVSGDYVLATSDHEILTTNGYIQTSQLTTSHKVVTADGAFTVISVEYQGIKPTYDIQMLDPYRNFVANNIVVHNCGKALSLDTKVYTLTGSKPIKDIQVGDYVFNKQGKPVLVTATYDNFQVNMCKITFHDGNTVECCMDHLWEINTYTGKQVVDTKWFFTEDNKVKPLIEDNRYLYSIDLCEPVEFAPQTIPLNPYYYGRNIDVKAADAYISNEYKYNCADVRFEVVKGIIERCSGTHYTINTNVIDIQCSVVSKQLANDLQFMFESLGCTVDIDIVDNIYTLTVQTNNYSRFIEDKTNSKTYKEIVRYITNIEPIGISDAKCITVQDEKGLYLIDHFIVTHNTKQMIDLACIKKQMYGYEHCLVIACVNGLKYNWQAEIGIHSNETGYILGTTVNRKGIATIGSNEKRLKDLQNIDNIDSYFIITNIETLRYNVREKVPCKAKRNGVVRYKNVTRFPIVEELQKLIKEKKIGMIVADEVHKCLEAGTLVLTDKGLVPIYNIVHKKCYKVATQLSNGNIEYVVPTNYWTNPKPNKMLVLQIIHSENEDFFDFTTKIDQVICTPTHKFLMSNGTYKEAKDIELGEPLFNGYIQKRLDVDSDMCVRGDYVYDLEIPNTHNYIIYDNIVVHNCKDSTSLQGKALLALNAESMVALTGTPLMNNAIDLYTPLKFIGKENHSLFQFKSHYCILGGFGNHQIVGYKNLPELQAVLDKCMLRRLKKDVLDLPDKIYVNDYVEMTPSQIKIYNSILEDLRQNIDKVKLSPNPLTMLIRLRQCTGNPELLSTTVKGNPKYERMLDLIEELVKEGKKAIVFSNWTDVLNPAYELLAKNGYRPALYTGQNKDTREAEKTRFMTDKSCKVICGTIGAMGTGLTLTEATTIIFLDEPWNRAIKDQAEDRAHRIGTTENLTIITIMCKNTIDEKINNIVYRKGKMSDIIVDKEEDLFKNPQMLNYLLSD